MKKTLITLLIILFCIPLFGQGLSLSKNNKKQQIENFFSKDTTKTDTVYVIEYRYYENDFYSQYNPYYNWFYSDFYWSYYYNWFYSNIYWVHRYNWHNHHWCYPNHHKLHHTDRYKPRPPRPIRQRTITTKVRNDVRKREYVRPARTTETRYNRPTSTYQAKSRSVRQPKTYNRLTTTNRPTSTYNRPSSNSRSYNRPARSSNTNNRSGSSTRSSTSNRSSSGSRGRR